MAEGRPFQGLSGMSVAALDDAESWFRTKPEEIRATLREIAAGVDATVWRGPRADRFASALDEVLVDSVGRLEIAFASAADLLVEQGEQQRQASGWSGPSAPTAATVATVSELDVRG